MSNAHVKGSISVLGVLAVLVIIFLVYRFIVTKKHIIMKKKHKLTHRVCESSVVTPISEDNIVTSTLMTPTPVITPTSTTVAKTPIPPYSTIKETINVIMPTPTSSTVDAQITTDLPLSTYIPIVSTQAQFDVPTTFTPTPTDSSVQPNVSSTDYYLVNNITNKQYGENMSPDYYGFANVE